MLAEPFASKPPFWINLKLSVVQLIVLNNESFFLNTTLIESKYKLTFLFVLGYVACIFKGNFKLKLVLQYDGVENVVKVFVGVNLLV